MWFILLKIQKKNAYFKYNIYFLYIYNIFLYIFHDKAFD